MWRVTTEIASSIAREFKQYNTPVIFVLIPAPYQVNTELFASYLRAFGIRRETVDLDQPNKILQMLFQNAGLTLLDPLPDMRRKNIEGSALYGKVDRHLNTLGHEYLGQLIAPAVQSVLLAEVGLDESRDHIHWAGSPGRP